MGILNKLMRPRAKAKHFRPVYEAVSQGRMPLALERIEDLIKRYPDDPGVVNEKGTVYGKYLGRGLEAHDLYCQATAIGDGCENAWINATDWSLTKKEWEVNRRKALAVVKQPQFHGRMRKMAAQLANGSWGDWLAANIKRQHDGKKFGSAAAWAELLLNLGMADTQAELSLRRSRAQWLRELDKTAASSFAERREPFPASERLALHGALEELDRAIALDEYDHELWNFKAAWCALLDRFEEALQYTESSLEYAPPEYVKPFVNKVVALKELGRDSETQSCFDEALRRARGDEGNPDIVQMKKIIEKS